MSPSRCLPLALGLVLFVAGCDEKRSPTPAAESAKVAPTTSVAPAALPRNQKKKPQKKLEDCPRSAEIAFPSAEFEAAVRLKARKPTGPITKTDLAQLRSLNLSQIRLGELDICLFHHMTNLRELFLGRGDITDLSPLAGATKLESLRASLNPIEDIEPLAGMTKMDRLDLAHTQVRDLSPLEGMTELTELLLDTTPVSDVEPLAKLTKLRLLVLNNTQVKDLTLLKPLKALKKLEVVGAPIDDTTALMRPGLTIKEY